jgi:hypothetical protein
MFLSHFLCGILSQCQCMLLTQSLFVLLTRIQEQVLPNKKWFVAINFVFIKLLKAGKLYPVHILSQSKLKKKSLVRILRSFVASQFLSFFVCVSFTLCMFFSLVFFSHILCAYLFDITSLCVYITHTHAHTYTTILFFCSLSLSLSGFLAFSLSLVEFSHIYQCIFLTYSLSLSLSSALSLLHSYIHTHTLRICL